MILSLRIAAYIIARRGAFRNGACCPRRRIRQEPLQLDDQFDDGVNDEKQQPESAAADAATATAAATAAASASA